MLGEVMRILDGPFGVVDVVIENIQLGGCVCIQGNGAPQSSQNGTDKNYLDDFIRRVESITPEEIRALAQKYLHRDAFTTVVVGAPK
jgi:hypothetical protein